jgi:hypothetical protein
MIVQHKIRVSKAVTIIIVPQINSDKLKNTNFLFLVFHLIDICLQKSAGKLKSLKVNGFLFNELFFE